MSLSKSNFSTFGEKRELSWFVNELFLKRDSISLTDLSKIFYTKFNSRYLEGLIYLFKELNLITHKKDLVKQINKEHWSSFNGDITNLIAFIINHMNLSKEYATFFDQSYLFNEKNKLFFLGNSIPLEAAALRNLFISLEFFRSTKRTGLYEINKEQIYLLKNIPRVNLGRKFTQRSLEEELSKKEGNLKKAGNAAEVWVLNFEKKRYQHLDNSLIKGIERISQDYSRAGFDIISLINESSQFPDKLIEVKSYEINRQFYWSDNEINKAFEERENYFLYLVDRRLMKIPNYVPIEIQDPAHTIFNGEKRDYLVQSSSDGDYKIYGDGWKIEF